MTRLSALTTAPGFPGHGPAFSNVGAWAKHNAEYRQKRLAQLVRIFERLASDANATPSLSAIAAAAYGDNGQAVEPYIEAMADAQLRFLRARGDIADWS
jgi:hypothetical protein